MKKYHGLILPGIAIVAIVGLLVWYEQSIWDECMSKNSFNYCFRVLWLR